MQNNRLLILDSLEYAETRTAHPCSDTASVVHDVANVDEASRLYFRTARVALELPDFDCGVHVQDIARSCECRFRIDDELICSVLDAFGSTDILNKELDRYFRASFLRRHDQGSIVRERSAIYRCNLSTAVRAPRSFAERFVVPPHGRIGSLGPGKTGAG